MHLIGGSCQPLLWALGINGKTTDRLGKIDPFTHTLHKSIIPIDHALVIPNDYFIK